MPPCKPAAPDRDHIFIAAEELKRPQPSAVDHSVEVRQLVKRGDVCLLHPATGLQSQQEAKIAGETHNLHLCVLLYIMWSKDANRSNMDAPLLCTEAHFLCALGLLCAVHAQRWQGACSWSSTSVGVGSPEDSGQPQMRLLPPGADSSSAVVASCAMHK